MNQPEKNEIIKRLYQIKHLTSQDNITSFEELCTLEDICSSDQQLSSIYGHVYAFCIMALEGDPDIIKFPSIVSNLAFIKEFAFINYFTEKWRDFTLSHLFNQENIFVQQLCYEIILSAIKNRLIEDIDEVFHSIIGLERQTYNSLECIYQCIKMYPNLFFENYNETAESVIMLLSIEVTPKNLYIVEKILNKFNNQEIDSFEHIASILFDGFLIIRDDEIDNLENYDMRIANGDCISTLISSFYSSQCSFFMEFLNQHINTDDPHIFELCLIILQTLVLGEENVRESSLEIVFSVESDSNRIHTALLWLLHSLLLSHHRFPDEELPFNEIADFVLSHFSPNFICVCCEVLILLLDNIDCNELLGEVAASLPMSDYMEEVSLVKLIYEIAKRIPIEFFSTITELELGKSQIFYIIQGLIKTKSEEVILEHFQEILIYINQFDSSYNSISLTYSLYIKAKIDFDPSFLLEHFNSDDDIFLDSIKFLVDAAERNIFSDFGPVIQAIEASSNIEEISSSFDLLNAITQETEISSEEIIKAFNIGYEKFNRSEDVAIQIVSSITTLLQNPNITNAYEFVQFANKLVTSHSLHETEIYSELFETERAIGIEA